jgi:serine/threonine protein kinase
MPEAIGGYQLLAPLGKGAMGEVFSAAKPGMADPVALKVMASALGTFPELVERFRRACSNSARTPDACSWRWSCSTGTTYAR